MENEFLNTTTANIVALNLYNLFSIPNNELEIITKFIPHFEVMDRIAIYHRSYSVMGTTLWDRFNWDVGFWAGDTGENFDFDGQNYKIISKKLLLDKLENQFVLSEII
jgi:hypothetical protein